MRKEHLGSESFILFSSLDWTCHNPASVLCFGHEVRGS